MSSSCSCGESLQSLQLIPPDALDTLIYILEKRASCRGTFSHCRCRCCCFGRQCDCLLNSLVIALQVEKESQKNIPPRHKGWCSKAKRGQRDFYPLSKYTTVQSKYTTVHPPPPSPRYVSIMWWAAFHQQAADSSRNSSMLITLDVFPPVCRKSPADISLQLIVNSALKKTKHEVLLCVCFFFPWKVSK